VGLAVAAGCGSSSPQTAPASTAPAQTARASPAPPSPPAQATTTTAPHRPALCGARPGAPAVAKVMVIWEENHSYPAIIGSPSAPYLNRVAAECGLATNYHSATHPSLPNYLQATSGRSFARAPFNYDCSPGGACSAPGPSIFSQEAAAGHQWRSYEESMPSACDPTTTDVYAARHNPAVYYPSVSADCRRWDLPLGTPAAGALHNAVSTGELPSYSVVTPNVVDDMHDGSISEADAWLARWLPVITSGRDYRAGRLALFIVWDEGGGSGNQPSHVPLIVLSESTPAGTRVPASLGEYSLLRASESLTGIASYLGKAATASDLTGPFRL
jgi:hypothetical protein